jgi:S1-C subfamily serine protease
MRHKSSPPIFAVLCFWLEGMPLSVHAETIDLVEVSKQIRGQVVQIVVPTPDGKNAWLGSGFWLNDQGLVATCWHVVSGNPTGIITVQTAVDSLFALAPPRGNVNANWEAFSAKVAASDVTNDVAILKTDKSPFGVPHHVSIKIGNVELSAHFATATLNPSLPEPGQQAVLAGYPLGQPYLIVQEGTIAALAYDIPGWLATNKILVSTVSNHGSSGASVFDMQGKVIGVLEGEDRTQGQDQERTGISVVIPAFFVSELAKTIGP